MTNKIDDTLNFFQRLMNRQDSYLSHLRYYQDFAVSIIYCRRLIKLILIQISGDYTINYFQNFYFFQFFITFELVQISTVFLLNS